MYSVFKLLVTALSKELNTSVKNDCILIILQKNASNKRPGGIDENLNVVESK